MVVKEDSPAGIEVTGGRLLKSDVVVKMHLVSLLRAREGVVGEANRFVGHEQTLDMVVLRGNDN